MPEDVIGWDSQRSYGRASSLNPVPMVGPSVPSASTALTLHRAATDSAALRGSFSPSSSLRAARWSAGPALAAVYTAIDGATASGTKILGLDIR